MRFSRRGLGGCATIAVALAATVVATESVEGQRLGRFEQTSTNIDSFYYYVVPGTSTMQVHVLGTVSFPGLYEVNEGTDLKQLLALAGGPVMDSRLGSDTREVIVRVFRGDDEGQELEYQGNDYEASTSGLILEENDVLSVEVIQHRGFIWQDAVIAINAVALVALVIERVR